MYETYAFISNVDWITKDKRFREAYAPTDPTKVVRKHIDEAVAYADSGSMSYSPKKVVENAYQLVFNTGIFAANCRESNKQTAAGKTLLHIKLFFCCRPQGVAPLDSK